MYKNPYTLPAQHGIHENGVKNVRFLLVLEDAQNKFLEIRYCPLFTLKYGFEELTMRAITAGFKVCLQ